MRPGIEPVSSWILVRFVSTESQLEFRPDPFNRTITHSFILCPGSLGSDPILALEETLFLGKNTPRGPALAGELAEGKGPTGLDNEQDRAQPRLPRLPHLACHFDRGSPSRPSRPTPWGVASSDRGPPSSLPPPPQGHHRGPSNPRPCPPGPRASVHLHWSPRQPMPCRCTYCPPGTVPPAVLSENLHSQRRGSKSVSQP